MSAHPDSARVRVPRRVRPLRLRASARAETPPADPQPTERLSDIRSRIDDVDRRIVGLIARRARLAAQAGEEKRTAGLAAVDPAREAAVVRAAARLARSEGVDEEAVRAVFWQIVGLSRRAQASIDLDAAGGR